MHVYSRSYLTAGLSVVAAGAIIATPTTPLSPQPKTHHSVSSTQQLQLTSLATPLTTSNVADNQRAVHALAQLSRAFASTKMASAASAAKANPVPLAAAGTEIGESATTSEVPDRSGMAQTGAAITQNAATADAPDGDGHQNSTPRRTGVQGFDPRNVASVLANAARLAVDVFVTTPAFLTDSTAQHVDNFLLEVATLDPASISNAISNFIPTQLEEIGFAIDNLSFDIGNLTESVGNLFGIDYEDHATAVTAVNNTTPDRTTAAPASGAVDDTAPQHQPSQRPQTGASGKALVGKHSEEFTKRAKKDNIAGHTVTSEPAETKTDDTSDTKTDDVSGTKSHDASDTQHTTGAGNASKTKTSDTNTSDTKPGNTSQKRQPGKNSHNASNHVSNKSANNKSGSKRGKHAA